MRVVLDTNIYLSALMFPSTVCDLILHLARKGEYSVYCTNFILDEIRRVLISKFAYDAQFVDKVIDELLKFIIVVLPTKRVSLIKENIDDNEILACAFTANADYLVSGDKKHILPIGKIGKCHIVKVSEFIQIIK